MGRRLVRRPVAKVVPAAASKLGVLGLSYDSDDSDDSDDAAAPVPAAPADAGPAAAPVAGDWEELTEEASGESYWWNRASGETTWAAPAGAAAAPTAAADAADAGPAKWGLARLCHGMRAKLASRHSAGAHLLALTAAEEARLKTAAAQADAVSSRTRRRA
ncbi:hypothetical protein M885DRAFT_318261 [Pelagophyceae sp. CCMP2097]|nr:hypothetical protein M885DRAFT_318261 [Pelagophyceae sp. CCMP2097]